MKKGDFLWLAVLLILVSILLIPETKEWFILITDKYKYPGGFVKFAILATMGDMLGLRILKGEWEKPKGLLYKILIWGLIGMMVTLAFPVCIAGSLFAQNAGLLPFDGSKIAMAFFASVMMNLTFGPMMMTFHRFTDMYIDSLYDKNTLKLNELISKNDWHSLVEFTWLKACPFFWIPAHTIVFLLPQEYRVITSAFLSIALGILLAVSKKKKSNASKK